MLYRVDYAVAVLLAGFLIGVLASRATERIAPSRLARQYYLVVVVLLVVRTGAFVVTTLASGTPLANTLVGVTGDFSGVLFGAVFGLATRRRDARKLLTESSVVSAICMTIAFTFAIAGIGKAFSIVPMTKFFNQSGYPLPFLKFIVSAEILGGIGLLLPWSFMAALAGLTVDMFGAVLTHVHNGDPLNDSAGAIGMLIRLIALGVLWAWRGSIRTSSKVRNSMLGVAAAVLACLLIALGGSVAVRKFSSPLPTAALEIVQGAKPHN